MKTKTIITVLTLSIICSCNLEKIPDFAGISRFQTTVGGSKNDFPYAVIPGADGTYIIVGRSESFTADQNNQAYIVKLDNTGTPVKQEDFGDTALDLFYDVTPVSAGGYMMCGIISNPIDFNFDILIVKVDEELNSLGPLTYGSVDSNEIAFGIIPIGTSDFMVGYTSQPVTGGESSLIFLRINSNGLKVSSRFGIKGPINLTDMIKTSDGKIVVCGSKFDSGTASYLAKFDANGAFIWEQSYPESNPDYTPAYGVKEIAGELIVAGSYLDSDHDYLLLKYTGMGMFSEDYTWGGPNDDELLSITNTQDDQVVVMGYTNSINPFTEIYFSKRDISDGSTVWEKNFERPWVISADVALCPDGGFILVTGQNESNADIIVIKTDPDGNFE